MSSRRHSPAAAKRTVALKRVDGEPLTRSDIQYDVLYNIFHDAHDVFTNPFPSNGLPSAKLTFRDLYIKTILNSSKATKVLKDKMYESEAFSEDFAMLALLVNVGRINTTMSFFPEMKTAIRTYHPVPSLQRTTGNLQDAPRIKHILKSATLENEGASLPVSPADILGRLKAGSRPSTTVTNLIFILSSHSTSVGHTHFSNNLDFIDLFLRGNVSSSSRAQAFLWLCYHYLESASRVNDNDYDNDRPANPFDHHGNLPPLVCLSDNEATQENVDTPEEKALAQRLIAQRTEILRNQGSKDGAKSTAKFTAAGGTAADDDDDAMSVQSGTKLKVKLSLNKTASAKGKLADRSRSHRLKDIVRERGIYSSDSEEGSEHPTDRLDEARTQNRYPEIQTLLRPGSDINPEAAIPYRSLRNQALNSSQAHQHRYSPYSKNTGRVVDTDPSKHLALYQHARPLRSRSMLQQAWRIVTTTDPLDSDDEIGDEEARNDYIQRLQIIGRLYDRHLNATQHQQVELPSSH